MKSWQIFVGKIRRLGIRNWWSYLMNHTKICLSSSEIITPFFVNCVKIADWLGSNSLAIWSLCLSSSFWILLLEPAMIFMGDFFYQNYFDHFWQFIFLPVEIFSQRNTQKNRSVIQFNTVGMWVWKDSNLTFRLEKNKHRHNM